MNKLGVKPFFFKSLTRERETREPSDQSSVVDVHTGADCPLEEDSPVDSLSSPPPPRCRSPSGPVRQCTTAWTKP